MVPGNYADLLPRITQYRALLGSAQDGLVSAAARRDLAAAAAAVLTQDGHVGATYELGGAPFTLTALAATFSGVLDTSITYQDMSVADCTATLTGAGPPPEMAAAVADADAGLARRAEHRQRRLGEADRPADDHGPRSHPRRRGSRGVTMATPGTSVYTHEMVLIHRVIRREFGQLPRLFRSAADNRAQSKVIGAHAKEMLDFLHTHHTGEDQLLFPLLRGRTTLDPELMARMDAQHAAVDTAVTAITADLPGWTASANAAAGERMASVIDATMPTLLDHLAEEERQLLPIVAVTLTQGEWDALGKHGMSAIPLTRRLIMLGHITEETDDAERQRFLRSASPGPMRDQRGEGDELLALAPAGRHDDPGHRVHTAGTKTGAPVSAGRGDRSLAATGTHWTRVPSGRYAGPSVPRTGVTSKPSPAMPCARKSRPYRDRESDRGAGVTVTASVRRNSVTPCAASASPAISASQANTGSANGNSTRTSGPAPPRW